MLREAFFLPSREGIGGVLEYIHMDNKADKVYASHTPPFPPSQEGNYDKCTK